MNQADEALLQRALANAVDTRALVLEPGCRHRTVDVFRVEFGSAKAVLVADENTFQVAGRDVLDGFRKKQQDCAEPLIFGNSVTAHHDYIDQLVVALAAIKAVPVAVGSGTINDLTKLAASRLNRPYLAVATAASMDGYTAYGASITYNGSKQTFDCPAPRAVVADLDVVPEAPAFLNAAGYGDLMAKSTAGGDWILADAAGEEAIERSVWGTVQTRLQDWLSDPAGVASGNPDSLRNLLLGLMMTGFAMQAMRSIRPASGAEHQFSHLWDMQHHTHNASAPLHGFKVGIGTLASLALYDYLLYGGLPEIDVDRSVELWQDLSDMEARISREFGDHALCRKSLQETRAKHASRARLKKQLLSMRDSWPSLRVKLQGHLPRFDEARDKLQAAGCPVEPRAIGITPERLLRSYEQAWYIRRRYTVLDFAYRTATMTPALGRIGTQWLGSESLQVV